MDVQGVMSISTSLLENLLFSGIMLGWPSLQYVLLQEGYFHDQCDHVDRNGTNEANATESYLRSCGKRDATFNLVYTLASSISYLTSCLCGFVLDRYGTWVFRTLQSSLMTASFVLLAVSSPDSSWLIFLSVIALWSSSVALGSSNVQVANLSTSFKGLIISLQNGTYIAGTVVFLLVKLAYNAGIDFHLIFLFLTLLSITTWMRTFFLMPKKLIPFPLPPPPVRYGWKEWGCYQTHPRERNVSMSSTLSGKGSVALLKTRNASDPEMEVKDSVSSRDQVTPNFKSCLCSALFCTNLFHFCVSHIRLVFYYGIFVNWIKTFESIDKVNEITSVFGLIPISALVISPLGGALIDGVVKHNKRKCKNARMLYLRAMFFSAFASSLLSSLMSIAVVTKHSYSSVLLTILTSCFLYCGNWTFLALAFPIQHFGKLLGITHVITGIALILQFALFSVALSLDPTFKFINIGFLVIALLTFIHPATLYCKAFR